MPFDPVLFAGGFIVGAGCITMLGGSLMADHPKHVILPITIACALLSGGILGWSLNYFFHFAQMTGPPN